MVRRPSVFLFDEPLSNLDANLRQSLRSEIRQLHDELGVTFVYVTHDQHEAMSMSDRVAVMKAGRILQLGTPQEIYQVPQHADVAAFVGAPRINFLTVTRDAFGRPQLLGQPLAEGFPEQASPRQEVASTSTPNSGDAPTPITETSVFCRPIAVPARARPAISAAAVNARPFQLEAIVPPTTRAATVLATTSEAEEDILRSYDLHANAYVTKPVTVVRPAAAKMMPAPVVVTVPVMSVSSAPTSVSPSVPSIA